MWSEDERLLQLLDATRDTKLYLANVRALTKMLKSESKEWITCVDEPSVRFKRSSVGSTRHRTIIQEEDLNDHDSFAVFENDSGMQAEMHSATTSESNEQSKIRRNIEKLRQIINCNQKSEKLNSLLTSLNCHFENEFKIYETEDDQEEIESTESIFEPPIKRSREVPDTDMSPLNSFMIRGPQRRSIRNPMQTLILKLSTEANLSSRQIVSCIEIMQTEIKIWEDEVYKKGMTSDRVIRSIAYRILPLHEFFVKDYLENSEYLLVCFDGARHEF